MTPGAGLGSTGAVVLSLNISMSHFCSFNYPGPGLSFFICSWGRKEKECSPSSSLSLLKGMRQVWPSKEERHSLAVQRDPGFMFREAKRKSHSSTSII